MRMSEAINLIVEDKDFIISLSDKLMLDEILYSECNPSEFLVQCIREVMDDRLISHYERRLKYLKDVGLVKENNNE